MKRQTSKTWHKLLLAMLISGSAQAAVMDFNGETSSALLGGLQAGQGQLQTGVQALRQGRYEEAQQIASKEIDSNPQNFKAHLLLCLSLIAQGDNARLHTHLQELKTASSAYASAMYLNLGKYFFNNQQYYRAHRALAQVSEAKDLPEAHLYIARSYEQQRRMEQAISHYRKLLEQHPEQHSVLLDLSRLYLVQKDFVQAADYAQRYLQHSPDHTPARFNLGIAKLLIGDYAMAEQQFAALAKKGDQSVQLKTYQALALLLLDQPDAALAPLKGLTSAESRVFETQFLKALIQMSQGDFAAARVTLAYLQQNNAGDPLTQLFQAVLDLAGGQEKSAQKSLMQASGQVVDFARVGEQGLNYYLPDRDTALKIARSALLYRQGVHPAVVATAEAAKPAHWLLDLYRARALWQQNQTGPAQQAYRDLLEREPDLLSARVELADTHFHLGEQAEAVKGYEEAARRAPGNLLIQVNLANLYNATGQVDQAIASYQALLKNQPNAYLLNQLAATYGEKKHDYPRSIKHALEAAKLDPQDLSIKDTLAYAYLQSKQPEKAKPLYEKILATTEWNQAPQTFFRIASMYEALGEKQKAARFYELALNTGHGYDEAEQAEARLKTLWGI